MLEDERQRSAIAGRFDRCLKMAFSNKSDKEPNFDWMDNLFEQPLSKIEKKLIEVSRNTLIDDTFGIKSLPKRRKLLKLSLPIFLNYSKHYLLGETKKEFLDEYTVSKLNDFYSVHNKTLDDDDDTTRYATLRSATLAVQTDKSNHILDSFSYIDFSRILEGELVGACHIPSSLYTDSYYKIRGKYDYQNNLILRLFRYLLFNIESLFQECIGVPENSDSSYNGDWKQTPYEMRFSPNDDELWGN
ncbi:hypothetical protein FACS189487_05380 [Campylobacterota bacterium]|nr:hypothetical protein FACS189487_05380 [Campylobacterota bacterium]